MAKFDWPKLVKNAVPPNATIPPDTKWSVEVTFFYRQDQAPPDYPFGPDIDNLLKYLFDAMKDTIFKEASGGDSCITLIIARKILAQNENEIGATITFTPCPPTS